MSNKEIKVIKYSKVDVNNLNFNVLKENDKSNQLMSFFSYNHSGNNLDLYIQSPKIYLSTYGVPSLGEYVKTEKDRAKIKIPLDLDNPESLEFANMLKNIDAKLGSDEFKKNYLGKKWQKYKYISIYREGQPIDVDSDDEAQKKKTSSPRPPYMVVKIHLSYPDNTEIVCNMYYAPQGKEPRVEIDNVKSIADFANIIKWKSNIRFIMKGSKIWAHPPAKPDPQYGLTFKLHMIEVDPVNSLYNQLHNHNGFIDSDDEEDVGDIATTQVKIDKMEINDTESVKIMETKKGIVEIDSDESDDDSDNVVISKQNFQKEDSDDEEIVIKNNVKKIVELDSDSDDDEEEKPKPKAKSKSKVIKLDKDDSDDEKVKTKSKSKVAKR